MENEYTQKIKETFNAWQQSFNEYQVQFLKGTASASEIFETQKSNLLKQIDLWKVEVDKAQHVAEDQLVQLKAKLEELRVQVNLGKAEYTDKYEEYRKNVEAKMAEFQEMAKQAYQNNYNQFLGYYDLAGNAFKSGLEMAELQYKLAMRKGSKEYDELKSEIDAKTEEWKKSYEELQKKISENIDDWNKQVQQNIDYFRNWIGDLIYRIK